MVNLVLLGISLFFLIVVVLMWKNTKVGKCNVVIEFRNGSQVIVNDALAYVDEGVLVVRHQGSDEQEYYSLDCINSVENH